MIFAGANSFRFLECSANKGRTAGVSADILSVRSVISRYRWFCREVMDANSSDQKHSTTLNSGICSTGGKA